jgi:hypothetical protein
MNPLRNACVACDGPLQLPVWIGPRARPGILVPMPPTPVRLIA